jgi:AcrR family transcriptional regulator
MQLRAAKAEATKARIRHAAAQIHAERMWEDFTLDEVATRAATTVQTILRIFGSKEALSILAMQAAADRQRPITPPGDIAAAIHMLYGDYAEIGDRVIRHLADEPRHPGLAPQIAAGRQAHRSWIETVFAPQLAARAGKAREDLVLALIVAADVYTWKILVRDQRLARTEAERLVISMITSLMQGGNNGTIPLGLLGRRRQPDPEPRHRPGPRKPRP